MSKQDKWFLGVLATLAVFVWLRDMGWVSTMDDTLPILVALPLFFWLEWPWRFNEGGFELAPVPVAFGTLLFVGGVVANFTLFMAIGWCLLLWTWIKKRVDPAFHKPLAKLMILPLMAFPWVSLDAFQLGWWFRLSGAYVTGLFYSVLAFDVVHEGTQIIVNGLPISVDVSCAGLNTLQSMLIAGSVLAYIQLGHLRRYWLNIPLIAFISWLANTIRITMLTGVALGVSPEFAMGPFHEAGGWVVLFIMFCLCWGAFTLQQNDDDLPAEPIEP